MKVQIYSLKSPDDVFGSAGDEIAYLRDGNDDKARARKLAGERRTVVARCGADGVLAVSASGTLSMPSYLVIAVNTVGAGDAFDAGFITATVQGLPLADALRWGNAVAALKISRSGDLLANREEVLGFLNQQNREQRP